MLSLLIILSILAIIILVCCIVVLCLELISDLPNIIHIVGSVIIGAICSLIIGITLKQISIEPSKALDNIKHNKNIVYQIGVVKSISTNDIKINNTDYNLTTKVNKVYPIQVNKFKIGDKVRYKIVSRELSDYIFSVKKLSEEGK